ncbi:hypothetical protein PNOK_0459700 [Pyrrhoderma noxium]|uniref:Uncharacterized protein n=1 Tax=Pyrrhoderma noxium TaxID=2282107 RepID=A0A286UJ61_9AGAM|nr:hypothetical protein PNOK_0459700 [Pyrrhoderma noxium]
MYRLDTSESLQTETNIGPILVCIAYILVSSTLLAGLFYVWSYLTHSNYHALRFPVFYGTLSNVLSIILLAVSTIYPSVLVYISLYIIMSWLYTIGLILNLIAGLRR